MTTSVTRPQWTPCSTTCDVSWRARRARGQRRNRRPDCRCRGLRRVSLDLGPNVNLTGTFLVTKRAIPLLEESPAASVITMSSLAGLYGYPNRVAYSTTNWGSGRVRQGLVMELDEEVNKGTRVDRSGSGEAACPLRVPPTSGSRDHGQDTLDVDAELLHEVAKESRGLLIGDLTRL